ncbi:DUF6009 family protein [[Kitasatospora] papulosa]|uniref:DUF6009 family protein n=1 Tax=[Kitasatospora] papulosa TaxID=1464011 RepID=UPI0036BC7D01
MSALISDDEIKHETDIVWLEDVSKLDYVRQSLDRLPTRSSRPTYCRPGRMVGYATLDAQAKSSRASGTFRRRVFWLGPHDRDSAPTGLYKSGAPSEAVDPRTVAPRRRGQKTERSDGPQSPAMKQLGIALPL